MRMPSIVLAGAVLFTQLLITQSIFIPWSRNSNTSSDEFLLPRQLVELSRSFKGFGSQTLEKYKNISKQKSLDERCFSGNMPMSVAWHTIHPYSYFVQVKKALGVRGMFPSILSDMLQYCCRDGSDAVKYGKFLRSPLEAEDRLLVKETANEFDFTFPIHAPPETRSFRDHPFIPLVHVPSVVLLAYEENERTSRTHAIATTILKAWPIMVFILLTATFSGIIIWFLDHRHNPQEFPQSFMKGAWEGFWWALVTMTTVGYGDRSPKSSLGRAFCILWIITGLVIISIFIAMVTASLSATTHPYFPIHGSLIGVVNGSEEYQLGVLMNAEMKVFPKVQQITMALLKSEIDGAFVDSFIITSHLDLIRDHPIRIDRTIEHPVTYGMVLARNSSRTADCMRRYAENYPRKVFQKIAEHLKPLKNPSDDVSQEVKAAEGLFYEEDSFKMIVYCGVAILAALFIAGLLYEYVSKKYIHNQQNNSETPYQSVSVELANQSSTSGQASNSEEGDMEELLQDYKAFHDNWVEKCKRIHCKVNGC